MRQDEAMALGELLEIWDGRVIVRTKLQELVSDTEFTVLQPTVKGMPLRAEHRDVTFVFYRASGCYSFSARISAPFIQGGLRLCRVTRVSEIKKIQRRQYYRLPIVLDVHLYELDDEERQTGKRAQAKTRDIAERSMAVSSFTRFEPGTMLTAAIRLSDVRVLLARAEVLRISEPLRTTDPYDIVLIFTDSQRHGTDLRRYIFEQQVLLRKKRNPKQP